MNNVSKKRALQVVLASCRLSRGATSELMQSLSQAHLGDELVALNDAAIIAEILGAIDDLDHDPKWEKKALCSRMMQAKTRLRALLSDT